MKNQKGITLIALVVTIIVLLILAGISIAMLTGDNGILINAQKTVTYNAYYSADEQVKLAYMAVRTEIMAKTVTDGTYDAREEANAEHLANIVYNDLVSDASSVTASKGTWKVSYEGTGTVGKIYITYTDTNIDQNKINDTTPAQEGVVNYTITLSDQSATLQVDTGTTVTKTVVNGTDTVTP